MKKNKFIRPLVFASIAVISVFLCLLILNARISSLIHSKVKNACEDRFNCDIEMEKPHVNMIKGIVVFNNISIDKYIGGRKFNVNIDKVFININMASAIKNILYHSDQITEFYANIDFGHKKHIKADLRGKVDIRSSKGDFSLETKCSNIDIAHIGQHYADAPIYVKEGTVDISLIGTCRKGKLDFSQRILTKDLSLSIKEEQDLGRQIFIGLTYRDIINYVKAKKGNINLNFIIKGKLTEPEVDLSPITENILTEIMALKISSGLQEWIK